MKALVVEDDFTSRRLLQNFLLKHGQCDAVPNGEEAVEEFRSALDEGEPYDLVCLDIVLPGINGLSVLKSIRRLEKESQVLDNEGTNVIMITGLADEKSVIEAASWQCNAYLVKPIQGRTLNEFLQSFNLIDQDMP